MGASTFQLSMFGSWSGCSFGLVGRSHEPHLKTPKDSRLGGVSLRAVRPSRLSVKFLLFEWVGGWFEKFGRASSTRCDFVLNLFEV